MAPRQGRGSKLTASNRTFPNPCGTGVKRTPELNQRLVVAYGLVSCANCRVRMRALRRVRLLPAVQAVKRIQPRHVSRGCSFIQGPCRHLPGCLCPHRPRSQSQRGSRPVRRLHPRAVSPSRPAPLRLARYPGALSARSAHERQEEVQPCRRSTTTGAGAATGAASCSRAQAGSTYTTHMGAGAARVALRAPRAASGASSVRVRRLATPPQALLRPPTRTYRTVSEYHMIATAK